MNNLYIAALVVVLLLAVNNVRAASTYCNKFGDSVVCNTYHTDGKTESNYYNQFGNTTVSNNYDNNSDNE